MSPDKSFIVSTAGKIVDFWNIQDTPVLHPTEAHHGRINKILFSPKEDKFAGLPVLYFLKSNLLEIYLFYIRNLYQVFPKYFKRFLYFIKK